MAAIESLPFPKEVRNRGPLESWIYRPCSSGSPKIMISEKDRLGAELPSIKGSPHYIIVDFIFLFFTELIGENACSPRIDSEDSTGR
jgi:hypothetical protein